MENEEIWKDVLSTVYKFVAIQACRDQAFMLTLSRVLKVAGLYQNWITQNGGINDKHHLYYKVEEVLNLWRDQLDDVSCIRSKLLQALKNNQRENNCKQLIAQLESKNGGEVIASTKGIIDSSSLKTKLPSTYSSPMPSYKTRVATKHKQEGIPKCLPVTSKRPGDVRSQIKESTERSNDTITMLVLGESGTGKSTLCNVMMGEDHDSSKFPANKQSKFRTQKTTIEDGYFRGDPNRPINIIDTQGFNDPGTAGARNSDEDNMIINELMTKLTEVESVNVFVVCINGTNCRLHQSLLYMLRLFERVFGHRLQNEKPQEDRSMFWDRVMVVFTNLEMSEKSIDRRKSTQKNLTDQEILKQNLIDLSNEFKVVLNKYEIIDALAPQKGDEFEKEAFDVAAENLYYLLSTQSPAMTKAMIMAHHKFETEKEKLRKDAMDSKMENKELEKEIQEYKEIDQEIDEEIEKMAVSDEAHYDLHVEEKHSGMRSLQSQNEMHIEDTLEHTLSHEKTGNVSKTESDGGDKQQVITVPPTSENPPPPYESVSRGHHHHYHIRQSSSSSLEIEPESHMDADSLHIAQGASNGRCSFLLCSCLGCCTGHWGCSCYTFGPKADALAKSIHNL